MAREGTARLGRPPLTERRKAATRLEVAREAVRLFASKGVAGTSAEEIAAAAGISVRTLWRYFPSKEDCVWPLLATGIQKLARSLRAWPQGLDLADLLAEVPDEEALLDLSSMLALVRLTRTEPGLREVWLRSHNDAEPVLVAAIAERTALAEDDLRVRVHAAMINSALRVAVEQHALHTPAEPDPDEKALISAVRTALRIAADGLPG
jgi:AcrR family transcriptional regulator